MKTESCTKGPCPCVQEWSDWSACRVSCGDGTRLRYVMTIREADPGGACPELQGKANEDCLNDPCPCVLVWSPWSSCNCGAVTRTRNVTITREADPGGACPKEETMEVCGSDNCPNKNIGIIVGTIIGSVIIIVILFFIYWKFEEIKNFMRRKDFTGEVDHILLKKGTNLPQTITDVINDENQLNEEFNRIEEEAQEKFAFPTNIARENMQHNRYKDVGNILI